MSRRKVNLKPYKTLKERTDTRITRIKDQKSKTRRIIKPLKKRIKKKLEYKGKRKEERERERVGELTHKKT